MARGRKISETGVHYLARLRGWSVPGEIGVEERARHAAALLDGRAVPAGEQQSQEVRKAARHGPDVVRRGAAGADGEDRLAVSGREAVLDAVRALAADNLRAARRTEVRLPAGAAPSALRSMPEARNFS